MLTLLLGGARSGKSTLAVQMAERQQLPVVFVATAEAFDDDMAERIRRHREERPAHWTTVEAPVSLAEAVDGVPADTFVVIDCLTVWMANLMVHDADRAAATERLLAALIRRAGPTVVVSNEVGMGIVPEHPMGREYRDDLGRLNQQVAALAHTALLLVAGRATRLDDPWTLLT
jgi:adenosyl cobinamide kinase/adenosyl cobinamide phosphate guanylyltransferase